MMIVKQDLFRPLDNNCYLIADEKTNQSALVDCSVWDDKMKALIGDTDLKYILLTHGNFDHIGGVKAVKERYGAKVVISKEDEGMLSSGKLSLAAFTGNEQNDTAADITVSDGDSIMLADIEIKVLSTPGHTKGSVCYLAEDCLFSGDTLFCESCGRTDFPGGSGVEMLRSLKRLAALEGDYRVFAGHDENSTLEHERKFNPYMKMRAE